jgi:3-oxoacyl-[acyl-carrier-protein] synthase III
MTDIHITAGLGRNKVIICLNANNQVELGLNRQRNMAFAVGSSYMSFLEGLDAKDCLPDNGKHHNAILCSEDISTIGLNWKELRGYRMLVASGAEVTIGGMVVRY